MNSTHLHFVADARLMFMTFYGEETTKSQSMNRFTLGSLLHSPMQSRRRAFIDPHEGCVAHCSFIFRLHSNG